MNRQQRFYAQITSSILTVLIPIALKFLGVGWASAIAIGVIVGLACLILTSSLSRRIQNFSTGIALGLMAIATVVLIIFGLPQIKANFQTPALVYGYVGGERYDLLVRNSQTKKLLDAADLQLTEGSITKKGSISQLKILQSATKDNQSLDFIWTGDAPIAEGGKQLIEAQGLKVLENEATLSDPLVLVVNKAASQTLAANQFFTPLDGDLPLRKFGFTHTVDTVKFADFLLGNLAWQEIGLTQYASLPGVIMSNARKSNGGVMAETLIGTIWHNLILQGLINRPQLSTSTDITQFQPLPANIPEVLAQKINALEENQ